MKRPFQQKTSPLPRPSYWRPLMLYTALLGAITLATFGPDIWRANQPFRDCRANPSATCLVDLGLSKAALTYRLPYTGRVVTQLARMGRLDVAHAMAVRRNLEQKEDPADAVQMADGDIASLRLAAALRDGIPLKQALRDIPEALNHIHIAALDIAGRNPYEPPRTAKTEIPPANFEIISQMADALNVQGQAPQRNYLITYAANLQAMMGNRQGAIEALSHLQKAETVSFWPSDELARLIGAKEVWEVFERVGNTSPNRYFKIVKASTDPTKTDAYLRAGFSGFATFKPWPEFSKMSDIVQLAMAKGRDDLALELAREMVLVARKTPSLFNMFDSIYTAKALFAANAPLPEIHNSLSIAQNRFPNNKALIGIGFNSGPMQWKASGLRSEAHRGIARLYARLGEIDPVYTLMKGIKNPRFAWDNILASDISLPHLHQMLQWADETLDRDDMAYVTARLAARIIRQETKPEKRRWAQELAFDLLNAPLFGGDRAGQTYTSTLRVAARVKDVEMQQKALHRLAESALESRDFQHLIAAGFEWHLAAPEN